MAQQALPTLTPEACATLGLNRDPFADCGELGFVFADAAHKTQLNVTLQLLQASDRLLILRGESGIGKSAFLHGLLSRHTPGLRFACIQATAETDFDTLLARFMREVRLVRDGENLSFDLAATRLSNCARDGERAVLLLDDAARLDDGVLSRLLSLRMETVAEGAPFGLMLAVEPEFDARLEAFKANPRAVGQLHIVNLYPYSEKQSVDYLTQRLALAGDAESVNLTEEQKHDIHARAKGVPAALNREASKLLLERAAKMRSGIKIPRDGRGKRATYAAAAASVLVLAGVLVAGVIAPDESAPTTPEIFESPAPATLVSVDASADPEVDTTEAPYGLKLPKRYNFDREDSMRIEPAQAEADDLSLTAAPTPPDSEARQPKAVDSETEATLEPQPTIVKAIPTPPAAEPEQTPVVASETAPAAPAVAPRVQQERKPQQPEPAVATAEADSAGGVLDESWLLARDGRHYTVQLIGAHDRGMLLRFIQSHGLSDEAALVRTLRDGKDWYVVVLGDHPDVASAKARIAKLSGELRDNGPFVRRIEVLQKNVAR